MASTHWTPPDVVADLLSEAMRPDAAEPVAIHVRPEIHALILRQSQTAPAGGPPERNPGSLDGIRLVVDDRIPANPGYEIHRAVRRERGRTSGDRSGGGAESHVAGLSAAGRRPERTAGSSLPSTGNGGSGVPDRLAG